MGLCAAQIIGSVGTDAFPAQCPVETPAPLTANITFATMEEMEEQEAALDRMNFAKTELVPKELSAAKTR